MNGPPPFPAAVLDLNRRKRHKRYGWIVLGPLLAVLLTITPLTYYAAKVPSFACTSMAEVHRLKGLREEPQAFVMALVEKQVHGECFAITAGTVVEGAIEDADPAILRINKTLEPPGFEAPLEDFEAKPAAAAD